MHSRKKYCYRFSASNVDLTNNIPSHVPFEIVQFLVFLFVFFVFLCNRIRIKWELKFCVDYLRFYFSDAFVRWSFLGGKCSYGKFSFLVENESHYLTHNYVLHKILTFIPWNRVYRVKVLNTICLISHCTISKYHARWVSKQFGLEHLDFLRVTEVVALFTSKDVTSFAEWWWRHKDVLKKGSNWSMVDSLSSQYIWSVT